MLLELPIARAGRLGRPGPDGRGRRGVSLPAKVLVANRGEIAVRIIAHAAAAGDRERRRLPRARRRRRAPSARPTRRSSSSATTPVGAYLDVEAVVEAARRAGADAVHPGLRLPVARTRASPRPWPEPASTSSARRRTAIARHGRQDRVPSGWPSAPASRSLPGSDGAVADARRRPRADEIGYPVLLKAARGGGGKGMRIVRAPADLREAFERAPRRGAGAASATAACSWSASSSARATSRSRCSPTRTAPSSTSASASARSSAATRRSSRSRRRRRSTPTCARAHGRGRVAPARAVGYVAAGPSSSSLDADGGFFFLEMNTRLQVEHPVTELVTGHRPRAEQMRIAAGEPLALGQDDVALRRPRDRVPRSTPRTPTHGFLPATGRARPRALPDRPGRAHRPRRGRGAGGHRPTSTR